MPRFPSVIVFTLWTFTFQARPTLTQDLSPFLDESSNYLFESDFSGQFDDLYLHSNNGEESKNLTHRGNVTAQSVRIDDGSYAMESGTLTTNRLAIGDPAVTPLRAANQGSLVLGAEGVGWGQALEEPFPLSKIDIRSSLGNLVPIPDDLLDQVPFDNISSNTPFSISLSNSEPVMIQEGLFLPIGFRTFELEPGDLLISLGEGERTLSPEFRQTGGRVEVAGNLELCVPVAVEIPIVDASLGVTEKVIYEHHGGELVVGGDLIVASTGAAPAEFVQTAGNTTVGRTVQIGGIGGTMRLEGGQLTARAINIVEICRWVKQRQLPSESSTYFLRLRRTTPVQMRFDLNRFLRSRRIHSLRPATDYS